MPPELSLCVAMGFNSQAKFVEMPRVAEIGNDFLLKLY